MSVSDGGRIGGKVRCAMVFIHYFVTFVTQNKINKNKNNTKKKEERYKNLVLYIRKMSCFACLLLCLINVWRVGRRKKDKRNIVCVFVWVSLRVCVCARARSSLSNTRLLLFCFWFSFYLFFIIFGYLNWSEDRNETLLHTHHTNHRHSFVGISKYNKKKKKIAHEKLQTKHIIIYNFLIKTEIVGT